MKLNSDLGEGYGAWQMGDDAQIMPFIDQANIACGQHAGDPMVMQKTIALAIENNVEIGAHPSYPDRQGFGRRSMKLQEEELIALLLFQIAALDGMAKAAGSKVSYVKPHGALYNDMMANERIFESVLSTLRYYAGPMSLMVLSTSNNALYESCAKKYGVSLIFEAFADRRYLDNGQLVPRSSPNALLNEYDALDQAINFAKGVGPLALSGKRLTMTCDSLCVHGDSIAAMNIVRKFRMTGVEN